MTRTIIQCPVCYTNLDASQFQPEFANLRDDLERACVQRADYKRRLEAALASGNKYRARAAAAEKLCEFFAAEVEAGKVGLVEYQLDALIQWQSFHEANA